MTTPERLRRRQHIIEVIMGVTLAVVGVGMFTQGAINESNRQEQTECFATQFKKLTDALDTRSDLAGQESQSTKDFLLGVARLTNELPPRGERTPAQEAEAQRRGRALVDDYVRAQNRVAVARERTPIPPYPTGRCDNPGGIDWPGTWMLRR